MKAGCLALWGKKRYNARMTQCEIAKRLGMSEQAVSKRYNGKSLPNAANIIALSKLFDKDAETLLKEFIKKQKKR